MRGLESASVLAKLCYYLRIGKTHLYEKDSRLDVGLCLLFGFCLQTTNTDSVGPGLLSDINQHT